MLIESCAVYSGLMSWKRILLHWPWVFKLPPEIFRPFTSFLLSSERLGIIFDPYMSKFGHTVIRCTSLTQTIVWQYGCALESESPHFTGPGDFFTYIMFVGAGILVSSTFSIVPLVWDYRTQTIAPIV